jgi:nucleotide-binding universal stress UspA family protein
VAGAAPEALRRRATLVLVHAYDVQWVREPHVRWPELLDAAVNDAEAIVADAALSAQAAAPGVVVRPVAERGDPVSVLLGHAESAALLVVGSRGRGGFSSLLLGSVGQALVTGAGCPVVIVRGGTGPRKGPVVVGVDECAAECHAIELAFEQAAGYGCDLVAVRAAEPSMSLSDTDLAPAVPMLEQRLATERRILTDLLAPWQGKYPQVSVEAVVSRRSAVRVLMESSIAARLVVVGSRGHSAVAGTLLGSLGLQLLHHAECPIMIAHG